MSCFLQNLWQMVRHSNYRATNLYQLWLVDFFKQLFSLKKKKNPKLFHVVFSANSSECAGKCVGKWFLEAVRLKWKSVMGYLFDRDFLWMWVGREWQLWPLQLSSTCPLSLIALVPLPRTPMSPHPLQQKDLLEEEMVVGHLFYDFFAIFLTPPSHPVWFSALLRHRDLGGGGGTIYIVAWEWRPCGPFCCEVGWGSCDRGRGGLPFVPASRVGFSSHRPGGPQGAEAPDAGQRWGNV